MTALTLQGNGFTGHSYWDLEGLGGAASGEFQASSHSPVQQELEVRIAVEDHAGKSGTPSFQHVSVPMKMQRLSEA